MTKNDWAALADKVQACHGPESNIEGEVAAAVGWKHGHDALGYLVWFHPVERRISENPPPYMTDVLRVAKDIVPPDWRWACGWDRPDNGGPWAVVAANAETSKVRGSTPCVALLVAACLARASCERD